MTDESPKDKEPRTPFWKKPALHGWVFLLAMGAFLMALFPYYIELHREGFQDRHPPGLNPDLTHLIDTASRQARAGKLDGAGTTLAAAQEVFAQLVAQPAETEETAAETETFYEEEDLLEGGGELDEAGDDEYGAEAVESADEEGGEPGEPLFNRQKVLAANALFAQAKDAIAAADKSWLQIVINSLNSALSESTTDPFFWDFYPLNLYEVLFWALAATLIRLIFGTGMALSKGEFKTLAVAQGLPLMVTVPILAVVITFVLSIVDFSLSLGESAITVDLSDVAFSILVGALIGLAPMKAWNFTRALAGVFFAKLGALTGAETPSDEEAAGEESGEETAAGDDIATAEPVDEEWEEGPY